jgi:dTDP-4-amino-4,6-dideoxygalactose transaminase
MNDIDAAIGLVQLELLDTENARRAQIAAFYREQLRNVQGVDLPPQSADRSSSFHLFPIRVDKRDALVAKMKSEGIGVGVHYRRNDEYPMYRRADLPGAEAFSSRVMSLPMHMRLSDDDAARVSETIRSGW